MEREGEDQGIEERRKKQKGEGPLQSGKKLFRHTPICLSTLRNGRLKQEVGGREREVGRRGNHLPPSLAHQKS